MRRPPTLTLFPYTTLFRSRPARAPDAGPRPRGRDGRDPLVVQRRPRGRSDADVDPQRDRKSTRLNSSHMSTSYAVFFLKKNKTADICDKDSAHLVLLAHFL